MQKPWFRFYTSTLDDPRLKQIARIVACRRNVVLATWTAVMALAARSPTPGVLLLAPHLPLYIEEIDDAAGNKNIIQTQQLLDAFVTLGMLELIDGDGPTYALPDRR